MPTIETQPVWAGELALSTVPPDSEIRTWMKPGTALGSRFLLAAMPVLTADSMVESASARELALMVVTDTWLDVLDRKKPIGDAWNCLIDNGAGTPSLKVLDYGLGLTELLGPPLLASSPMQVRCAEELRPYIDSSEVTAAIRDIQAVQRKLIEALTRSIPEDWAIEAPELSDVPEWLVARRVLLPALFASLTAAVGKGGIPSDQ